MVQRWENESKSQQVPVIPGAKLCCFQWFKDTKMKANHNSARMKMYGTVAVSNGSKILK